MAGGLSVERLDDSLGVLSRHMNRAIAEIDQQFWMSDGPLTIPCVRGGVPGVGARGRVAAAESRRHRRIADRSGVGTVADALVFAVPASQRQPHFEFHRRLSYAGDAAEFRKAVQRLGAWRRK